MARAKNSPNAHQDRQPRRGRTAHSGHSSRPQPSSPSVRLLSVVLCCVILLPQALAASDFRRNDPRGGGTGPAATSARQNDAPASGLPDLDEARRRPQHEPRAVPPVPSKRRRCPPRDRRCNDGGDAASPAPTPSAPRPRPPQAKTSPAPVEDSERPSHPAIASATFGRRPAVGLSLLDFYGLGGYSVTDAPVRLLPLAAFSSLGAPSDLRVTATSDTQVTLSWSPSPGATGYRVERGTRGASGGITYALAGVTSATTLGDQGVAHATSYLYRVCAADGAGNCASPFGNLALATAYSFADDPLVTLGDHQQGINPNLPLTRIRALHVAQLREAVNAVRRLAGLGGASWGEPDGSLPGAVVRAPHVTELRGSLDEGLTALGVPAGLYTDHGLGSAPTGMVPVKRVHFAELRERSTRGVVGGGAGVSSGQGTGLTAEYYDNDDFTGFVMTRTDPAVDFDWATGSPAPSMNPDFFSVRWSGMVVPLYTDTYTFYTTTDDGVRLWIDGRLVIDKWIDQAPSEWTAQVALEAGRPYAIRMEFYEHWGGAMARLEWSRAAQQGREVIPRSQLYPCWKEPGQFVRDLFPAALARQPSATELRDWSNRLTQAQGDAQLLSEAQALGSQVFSSAEYAARDRSDADYVADLYRGYLQREPDQSGWNYWTSQITACGSDQQCRQARRVDVRLAFAWSDEFQDKVRVLCGTSAASPANGGAGYDFSTARLDPANRTGGPDPYSRNFNFQIPLVSLAGRAGLDLGLTLSYNSLVWTKDATGVTFDADQGFPSPGFRLGFPTVEPKFYNPQTQKYTYLLVTPVGARVELRQTVTPGVYESADSSYLQLVEGGGHPQTLFAPDGTQLSFVLAGGEYRCNQVKDRNGNYLSVAYYGDGRIWTVSDTLGRVVTFNYDNYQNLLSITQPWRRDTEANPGPTQDETHQWATFGYADVTLQPVFSNLAVVGEQPGAVIPALSQVGLDDGSYYKFSYNQWGQVWKVTLYAADSVTPSGQPSDTHPLNSTRIDLPGSDLQAASAQTDCPRFTQERVWVENGVMNQSAEVTTSYDAWVPNMASCDVTMPDGTLYRNLYETSGWKRGLTAESQVWSGGVKKKWTTLIWDQDAPGAAYRLNPRVTQTVVNDAEGNQRRTTVSYQSFTPPTGGAVALRQEAVEYKEDAATVLRTTRTEYNLSAEYTGRRLLAMPSFQYVYEGTSSGGTLLSKVEYVYDDDMLPGYLQGLPTAASQHDGTNYGAGFRWRGNVSRVRRYDVTGGAGTYVESKSGYHVTGTTAFTKDASDHQSSVSYTDSFFQGINRAALSLPTYAYPTTVTDPDGFTVTTSYNYDMGVLREARTPLPNVTNNQPGPLGRRYYDAAGRLVKSLNVDTGGYTRTVYSAKMDAVQSYTLIEAGVESYTVSLIDGVGRTRATVRSLPGSVGGYSAQVFDYDQMGRVARQSNPTETNAGLSWAATGDDAANGWLYTQTTYDWKGRPLVVTHPKVNPADPNEQPATMEFEYGGCGCAGGEVVTMRGELVPIPGTPNQGRRTRKVYSDVLGRPWKVEVLDWNGGVYATATTKYDALDRQVRLRQYAGTAPQPEPAVEGSGYQTTTLAYDGHGRLQSRHTPEQNVGAATVYTYNADDTPLTVADGRGAVTTYSYTGNNRHLVTGITHTLSGATTLTVTNEYDAAGNRSRMEYNRPEAGLSRDSVTYTYDVLSRLTKESHHFANLTDPDHDLDYTYTLSGQLKTLTDPFGSQFTYGLDAAGQLTSVTGTAYAGITTYASNVQYRAWGGVKAATFGDGMSQTTAYDGRMRPSQYRLTFGGASQQRLDYTFNADDKLRTVTDLDDTPGTLPPSTLRFFSLGYSYDHLGRVVTAGGANNQIPYTQSYGYDAFNNMTSRSGAYWYQASLTDTATFTNNRRGGWSYDADGRLTISPANSSSNRREWAYDPAGRLSSTTEFASTGTPTDTLTTSYDGDGRSVREAKTGGSAPGTHYLVRSAVLGGEVVTRLTAAGAKEFTYVPAGGLITAQQMAQGANGQPNVGWTHLDPTKTSEPGASYDPLGNRVVPVNPPQPQSPPSPPTPMYGPAWYGSGSSFSNANNYSTGCYAASNNPTDCNGAMLQRMGREFVENLPGYYHLDYGENYYDSYVRYVFGGGNTNEYNYWRPGTSSQTERWDPNDPNYFGTLYVTDTSTLATGRGESSLLSHQNSNSASNSNVNHGPAGGANSNAATNPAELTRYGKYGRCPPTGQGLLRNPTVKKAIEDAKRRSNFGDPDPNKRREAGVWIYYNPITGRIHTENVPTERTGYDWTDFSNPPTFRSMILIADMHTHPTLISQGGLPEVEHETEIQFHKGVPGIAITEQGPLVYGPKRLGSDPYLVTDEPGYPNSKTDLRDVCP